MASVESETYCSDSRCKEEVASVDYLGGEVLKYGLQVSGTFL